MSTAPLKLKRKRVLFTLAFIVLGFIGAAMCVKKHPLVFSESLFAHTHCMPQASGLLVQYALEHGGKFPEHTNGYGDALLLLCAEDPTAWQVLTGPGYDSEAHKKWLVAHVDVAESECGHVYVQGLSTNSNPDIAILFDKSPSTGDHCHFPQRLWATPKRDVSFVYGGWAMIEESAWPAFASNQIELLIREGFARKEAKALYAEKGKRP